MAINVPISPKVGVAFDLMPAKMGDAIRSSAGCRGATAQVDAGQDYAAGISLIIVPGRNVDDCLQPQCSMRIQQRVAVAAACY